MVAIEIASAAVLEGTRTLTASTWVVARREGRRGVTLAMIGQNRLSIHSACTGESLFSLDWNGEMVVFKGDGYARACGFHTMDGAVTFLNAVLLSHTVAQAIVPASERTVTTDPNRCVEACLLKAHRSPYGKTGHPLRMPSPS